MTRASRRGAALATGGIAGLAIATLVLPQLANSLKPTALGIALLTLVLALLTLTAQRFGEFYRRRGEMESALLNYPPERLGEAEPWSLGMSAPRPKAGRQAEAGAGSAQPPLLDRALRDCDLVVVRGPTGGEKSNAAATSAARALPTVAAVIPMNANGLKTMQDAEFQLGIERCDDGICVWLDDLDRFLEVLDTRTLTPRQRRSPAALARRMTGHGRRAARLVATIRNDRWDEVRGGTGEQSQSLRRLAAAATVVTLDSAGNVVDVDPPLAQPSNEARGEEANSGSDDGGTRPAATASEHAGAGRTAARPLRARPLWHDPLFDALAVFTAAAAVAVGALYGFDKKTLVQAPPISDQIATITSQMESDLGRGHIVFSDRARLHSTEEQSWIIGVQHGNLTNTHLPVRSDELRIYDVHNGWLELELDFQPTGVGKRAATLQQVADNAEPAGLFNNGGIPEFIAGYRLPDRVDSIVPFGIDWGTGNSGTGYVVKALTRYRDYRETPGPEFAVDGLPATQAEFLQSSYSRPLAFQNRAPDPLTHSLQGYPVSAFALSRQPAGRLLLGYLLGPYHSTAVNTVEFAVGQIRHGGIGVYPCARSNPNCSGPRTLEELRVWPDKGDSQALLEEWPHLRKHWVHPIKETNA
jgi:hypothetical protein